jgi:hypothetical protein
LLLQRQRRSRRCFAPTAPPLLHCISPRKSGRPSMIRDAGGRTAHRHTRPLALRDKLPKQPSNADPLIDSPLHPGHQPTESVRSFPAMSAWNSQLVQVQDPKRAGELRDGPMTAVPLNSRTWRFSTSRRGGGVLRAEVRSVRQCRSRVMVGPGRGTKPLR